MSTHLMIVVTYLCDLQQNTCRVSSEFIQTFEFMVSWDSSIIVSKMHLKLPKTFWKRDI